MWLFDVNDFALSLWQDTNLVLREPGMASVSQKSMEFGEPALYQYKERPAQCHSQYWQKLNQEPTTRKSDGIATQADLIYQHILSIKNRVGLVQDSQIRVVVPNDTTNAQLELLYGVIDYLDLEVVDFVVSGIGATRVPLPPTSFFLDISLNRALLTEMFVAEKLEIGDSQPLARSGYIGLLNAWTNEITRVSLEESRFDPRKFGATEQQVFNRLLEYSGNADDLRIDIEHQRGIHHVSVKSEELKNASFSVFESIKKRLHDGSTVVLSHNTGKLGGLNEYLTAHGHAVETCTEDMLVKALLDLPVPSPNASSERIVHRSFALSEADSTQVRPTDNRVKATHVLHGFVATPIDVEFVAQSPNGEGEYFRLVQQGDTQHLIPSEHVPVRRNGRPVSAPIGVAAGDRINCGNSEFHLITVSKNA